MTLDSIQITSGLRSRHVCHVYNEAAFRHFLAVDRVRAQRSQRFLYLVLVALRAGVGRRAALTKPTATSLFLGLGASVREVDFVGWFVEGQVPAAVLAQGLKASDSGLAPMIAERVAAELKKPLSHAESQNLRVRVVRLGARVRR